MARENNLLISGRDQILFHEKPESQRKRALLDIEGVEMAVHRLKRKRFMYILLMRAFRYEHTLSLEHVSGYALVKPAFPADALPFEIA